jgi:hypothetical protein
MISLFETKPESKILFYRFSKKWLSFLYSLHKEYRVLDENDSGDRQI